MHDAMVIGYMVEKERGFLLDNPALNRRAVQARELALTRSTGGEGRGPGFGRFGALLARVAGAFRPARRTMGSSQA